MSRLNQWKAKYKKIEAQKEERINKYIHPIKMQREERINKYILPIEIEMDNLQSKIEAKKRLKVSVVADGEYKRLKYFKAFSDSSHSKYTTDFNFNDRNTICSNSNLRYTRYIVGVIPEREIIKGEHGFQCEYVKLTPMKDLRELDTWKWMVKHGIELNVTGNRIYTILSKREEIRSFKWESEAEHLEFITFLNENGVDFTFSENTNVYLHMCLWHNHAEVLKYLDEHGDITKSIKKFTPTISKFHSSFFKETADYAMSIAQRED